jgi:hypothetical protein
MSENDGQSQTGEKHALGISQEMSFFSAFRRHLGDFTGAQEGTRTPTSFRTLAPEASASTNSTTWAGCVMASFKGRGEACQRDSVLGCYPWPAAGFVDGRLSLHSAGPGLYGAVVAQFRVLSAGVLEAFDVVDDVCARLVSGAANRLCCTNLMTVGRPLSPDRPILRSL